MHIEFTDLVTIGLLVILEGLLSADNALVMAVMVLVLPEPQRMKALRYGILGAFALRIAATFLAVLLIRLAWVKLIGGLYLLYLPFKHFRSRGSGTADSRGNEGPEDVGRWQFWMVVAKINLVDLVFAIDSILAAVGLSQKLWVVITGGLLGILAIRLIVAQVLVVIDRYPALIDGAYVIIAWVGLKLILDYFHAIRMVPFAIPQPVGVGVVVLLFIASFFYARVRRGADREPESPDSEYEEAEPLLLG
jgi:YkoY family integral membrane protein